MVSEKRLEANRANARRSTGPRTPEGKARSRANGLKHGLTGAGVVLAGEDGPAVAERVEAWAAELRPRGEVEHWLVARAATASVRLDRCVRRECAKIDQAVSRAASSWDGRAIGHARAVGSRLVEDPAASVAELRRSAAGCDWMLGHWAILRRSAAATGALEMPQLRYALRLLGRADEPKATERGAASTLWGFGLAAIPEPDLEDIEHYYGLTPAGDATIQERVEAANAMIPADPIGRDGLIAAIDEQVARLSAWRAGIWEIEGPDRAATLDRARFDASPEAALMRRYETSATGDLHRALDHLARLRKQGLAADSDAESFAQDEPNEVAPAGDEAPAQDEPNATPDTPASSPCPVVQDGPEVVADEAAEETEAALPASNPPAQDEPNDVAGGVAAKGVAANRLAILAPAAFLLVAMLAGLASAQPSKRTVDLAGCDDPAGHAESPMASGVARPVRATKSAQAAPDFRRTRFQPHFASDRYIRHLPPVKGKISRRPPPGGRR